MELASALAQFAVLMVLVLAVKYRKVLINDCSDGNVERLEREERQELDAFAAKILLARMSRTRIG